jgi:hypothetical protein
LDLYYTWNVLNIKICNSEILAKNFVLKCEELHLETLLTMGTTSEDIGVDGRIILKCMSGKLDWRVWIVFIWLRIGTGGGLL